MVQRRGDAGHEAQKAGEAAPADVELSLDLRERKRSPRWISVMGCRCWPGARREPEARGRAHRAAGGAVWGPRACAMYSGGTLACGCRAGHLISSSPSFPSSPAGVEIPQVSRLCWENKLAQPRCPILDAPAQHRARHAR